MTRFFGDAADDDRRAADAAACLYGADAEITPRRPAGPYVASDRDADRDPRVVRAILAFNPSEFRTKGAAQGDDFRGATRFAGERTAMYIPPSETATLGYRIAAGDQVAFPEFDDAPTFRVARVGSPRMGFPGETCLILTVEGDE